MEKKLAVILGAGASYDLIPPNQRANVVRNNDFQPPLTEDLFNRPRYLEKYLAHYRQAYTAIGNIRNRLRGNQGSLEDLLRELKDSEEEISKQQFRQIPLYLQHLFGAISENYCRHPMNYSILLSKTLVSSISKVAYVTLNYDLFIEEALTKTKSAPFKDMPCYIPQDQNWMLIKLHGSVNWEKRIERVPRSGQHLDDLLENISRLELINDLSKEIEVNYSYKTRPQKATPFYPALSVPVAGDYKLNCPESHVETLKAFLRGCKNFLIIGTSGKDSDLLEILKTNASSAKRVAIVGSKDVAEAEHRFKSGVPQFKNARWQTYDDGFSNFIAGDIDRFLELIV